MPIAETVRGFKEIVEGKHDEIPEQAFYLAGTIDEVLERAEGAEVDHGDSRRHLRLEFVTPERAIVHEDVDEVELPGEEGYFGVLPGHAPLLAALQTGQMWYRKGGEQQLRVRRRRLCRGRCRIASRSSRRSPSAPRTSTSQRAEAAKRRAEERLAQAACVTTSTPNARASRCSAPSPASRSRARPGRAADAVMMRISSAVASHPGLRREDNEDAYCVRADLGLYMVADGMGGHAAGEVASRLAVEAIEGVHQRHARRRRQPHLAVPVRSQRSASTATA